MAGPFKVLMVGDLGVGKSSLARAFVGATNNYDPVVDAKYEKEFVVDKTNVKLLITDLAGYQSAESSSLDEAIKESDGFLFVYSIEYHPSFDNLKKLKDHIISLKGEEDMFAVVVCANKCDLDMDKRNTGQVYAKELKRLGKDWKVPLIETSVVESTNVEAAFQKLVRELRRIQNKEAKGKDGNCSLQ